MIKINYKIPNETESQDEIAIYNIKISDEFKKADYLEMSCIGWLKIDSKRDYQDLEQLLRYLNADSHIIAQPVANVPENIEINYPNGNTIVEPLKYVAKLSCRPKEDALKELLETHSSYEENFECLKYAGCLMAKNTSIDSNLDTNKNNVEGYEEIKKVLSCEIKLDFTFFKPSESINIIIESLKNKYGKSPEKIACGEINGKRVYGLMLNGEIASPIGWIDKTIYNTTGINIEMDDKIEIEFDYELVDFRKIKIEKN